MENGELRFEAVYGERQLAKEIYTATEIMIFERKEEQRQQLKQVVFSIVKKEREDIIREIDEQLFNSSVYDDETFHKGCIIKENIKK